MTKIVFARNAPFCIALACLLTLAHPAQAQHQHYYCAGSYLAGKEPNNWQRNTHLVTGVFEVVEGDRNKIGLAWRSYLANKYGGEPSGGCSSGDPTSLEMQITRLKG